MFAEPITTTYTNAFGIPRSRNGHHAAPKPPSPIDPERAAKKHAPTTDLAALDSAIDEVSRHLQAADHGARALKHLAQLYPAIAMPAAALSDAITAVYQQGHVGAMRTGHTRHLLQPRPAPLPEVPTAEEVRTWRERIGYSQWEFASICNVNSKVNVRRWQNGKVRMPADCVAICNQLSLPPIGGGSGEDLAGDAAMIRRATDVQARSGANQAYRREHAHVTRCHVCEDVTTTRCRLGTHLWRTTENALAAAMAVRPLAIAGGSGEDVAGDARMLMEQTLVDAPCKHCDADVATKDGHLAYGRQRLEDAWSALFDVEHVMTVCEDAVVQRRWLGKVIKARAHLLQLAARLPRWSTHPDVTEALLDLQRTAQGSPGSRCDEHAGTRRTPATFEHCPACRAKRAATERARLAAMPTEQREAFRARHRQYALKSYHKRQAKKRAARAARGEAPRSGANHPWREEKRAHFARKEAVHA